MVRHGLPKDSRPAHHERVRVGATGSLRFSENGVAGSAGIDGCCWVPASTGMTLWEMSAGDGEPGTQRGRGGGLRLDCWTLLGPPFDRLRAGSPGKPGWWVRRGGYV